MSGAQSAPVLQMIRRVAEDQRTRGCSDEDLLRQFSASGDEASFHALLRRHGPLVFSVCRAMLSNEADAEDAFQASFLILARKARSIRKAASLSSWLHGVAYRTALKAQAASARRHKHVARLVKPEASGPDDLTWSEVQRIVHEELDRLAERYRAPMVLCYLQGKTQDEAAGQLGLAKGTLKGRLERGRVLLRGRLVRRGLGPAALIVASAWPAAIVAAGVPPALMVSAALAGALTTVGQAASGTISPKVAALAEGVMRAMLLTKIKTTALAALVIGVLGMGGTLFWDRAGGSDPLAPHVQASDVAGTQEKREAQSRAPRAQNEDGVAQVVSHFAGQLQKQPVRQLPGGDQLGLFLMDVMKKEPTLIAAEVDQERAYCGSPCWSSDGRRILFDGSPGQDFGKTRLQVLETTEQGPGLSSFGPGNCPTLSPDDKHIAFLLNPGALGNAEPGIWVMQADGAQRRRVGSYGKPKWSPDGKNILIASFTNPCKLSLLDAETGAERPIELPGHQVYSVPSWIDKTTLVAVVRSDTAMNIALVDVTNPGQAKVKEVLWKRGDRLGVEPMYPVYSPRTKRCVFVGREKQGQALYSFEHGNADPPQRMEPGELDGKIASLTLSPDGRYVLFCSDRLWPRLPARAPNGADAKDR
jgi:RNA polymerase sigma factor (sigma-70 family)